MALLEGKQAVVYGAGAAGRVVAWSFACEGATVHLASRSAPRLRAAAAEIRADGGKVRTTLLDVLDPDAAGAHADAVVAREGRLDVSCNLTSVRATRSTATAASRHMVRRRSGVILLVAGHRAPVAFESLGAELASGLEPHGVRVVTLRFGGVRGGAGLLDDLGDVAVYAASDWGRTLSDATIDVVSGTLVA